MMIRVSYYKPAWVLVTLAASACACAQEARVFRAGAVRGKDLFQASCV